MRLFVLYIKSDSTLQSKILTKVFAMAVEIEKNLISQKKEALAKEEGRRREIRPSQGKNRGIKARWQGRRTESIHQ